MTRWLLVLLLGLTPLAAALAADEPPPLPPGANTMCPVLTDEPVDPAIFVDYQGKRVYLCCNRCRRKFIEHPEQYLANLPQFAGTPAAMASAKAEPAPPPSTPWRAVRFAGKFHPLVVHFPIALIVCAALFELLALVTHRAALTEAARYALGVGALSAVVAAALGWAAFAFAIYPGEMADTLSDHRWLGTGAAALAVVAVWARRAAARRESAVWLVAARLFLLSAVAVVGVAGHLGGTLVFGPDWFVW